jgi:hypothetical protein
MNLLPRPALFIPWSLGSLLALGATLLAPEAIARGDIPPEIQQGLGLECPPPCTICHNTLQGGPPADKPFVEKLKSRYGFRIRDDEGAALIGDFERALEASEAAGDDDTSGDGVSDREALLAGIDPNPGGARFCGEGAPSTPEYGCAARVASGRTAPGAAGIAALLALGLWRVVRARKR